LQGRSAVGLGGLGIGNPAQPLANFRGVHIPVPAGQSTYEVTFQTPEPDDKYAVKVQPNWLTANAITQQTTNGFTVAFDKGAPQNASLNWLIVR
jgi:hypothetical protein